MKRLLHVAIYLWVSVHVFAQRGQFFSSDLFSSSLISGLCQDQLGAIWIATDYGLNRFDGYHFHTYLHDDADSTSMVTNVVTTLLCDSAGHLWVGTNKGLDCYDADSETFLHYPFPGDIKPRVSRMLQLHDGTILVGTAGYGAFVLRPSVALSSSSAVSQLTRFTPMGEGGYFSRMYEDTKGRLWKSGHDEQIMVLEQGELRTLQSQVGIPQVFIEYNNQLMILGMYGLMVYDGHQLIKAPIDMSAVAGKEIIFTDMTIGGDGILYIGTRGHGLYSLSDRRLKRVEASAKGINQSTARISTVMSDRKGNLWIGCLRKGLLMLPQRPPQFANWSFEDQGISLGTTIRSVCEGDEGMVWCTVQDVGVYGFNEKGHVVAHPQAPDAVEFIFRDRQQRYWIGTDNGLYAYNPLTGNSQLKVTYDCEMFNGMTSDNDGRLYISTSARGFCVYDPQTGKLLNHNIFEEEDSVRGRLCNNWVMGLTVDNQGLIWMATASGVSCYDPSVDSFRSQGWNQQLNGVVCFDVCELHSGQLSDGRQLQGCIAIATEQGLYLYDRQTRQTERFPGSEQLQNKAVSYIVQANNGDLWCSTSMGIWQYRQDSHTFVGHISGNGLMQKEYLYGVGMHTDDDIIYFGHNDGLTVFVPASINDSEHDIAPLQLTSFRVGDQYVKSGTVINGVEVTDRAVSKSSYFTLSYLDHTITLAFSQFNFDAPSNITLEYSINDGEWIRNPAGQNEFTLGHLQPGTYRIVVRALQGSDYTPEKVIIVTIRTPWYRSLGAYFVYALLLISLIAYIFYTYRRRARQQLNEDKMKFLINATHDIRSPLTLILSPLHKALRISEEMQPSDEKTENSSLSTLHASLETIERNAKRILDLVNQILDVRKIDKQQMHLHCQRTDIVAFIRGICKMYDFNARERNIDFDYAPDTEELEAWIDRSQFDKVVSNLLSNAFKYCGEAGIVKVELTHDQQSFRLQVIDNGAGLDADNLKHIFDRFYQGRNARQLHVNGTGIGLNLCKMIVDMHHGTIEARNRTDGQQGALFIVTMPLGNSHLSADEIEKEEMPQESLNTNAASNSRSSQHYRVLVVDDDEEIANYIANELASYYQVSTAPDGREGLKELLAHDYDLVVSDVMMPKMDGFTMLRMIKTNMSISHIPVIMLTSKADVANRLEGLEHGADAFLAKPFDIEELHLTINNLIRGRQRLKGELTKAQQLAEKVDQPEVKGNDAVLMERIMKAINKNLFDSNFNVEMLTQEVGISRAQLNRKMKEMAGIPASELIRNIRLEQAARLLKEQKINITQVAYTVGFSNLAHFSTVFRKHFGVAPSEYADSEKE
ncbi:MAG: response regulator [Prevotella sp.]|nr:response regulator [Prevotella sp.]